MRGMNRADVDDVIYIISENIYCAYRRILKVVKTLERWGEDSQEVSGSSEGGE